MQITIENKIYETEQLSNGKWTLPKEIKEMLECGCFALNIDKGRVPTKQKLGRPVGVGNKEGKIYGNYNAPRGTRYGDELSGRYPSQTFIQCICDSVITEPTETKEPEEVSGGIWKKSTGKPAGRTYKGGNQIHTNPDCPCNTLDGDQIKEWQLKNNVPNDIIKEINEIL